MNTSIRFLIVSFLLTLSLGMTGCGRSPRKLASQGLAALERGENEEASALLEQALEGRESDVEAASLWGALGLARARNGRAGPAEDAFRIAAELAPEDYLIQYNLGGLLMGEGRFPEAIDAFDVAARVAPGRTEPLEMMATAAINMGERDRALRWLTEAAQRRESPRVLTSLATLSADRGNVNEVREILRKALDLDSGYAPANLNIAAFLDRNELDPSQAIHYYQRYLSLDPDGAPASDVRERMRVLSAQVTRENMGGDDRVTREVKEILDQADAAARGGNVQMALNHCLRAAAHASRRGRNDLEERALRIGVHTAPDQPRAHVALGRFFYAQARPAEALAAYRDAGRLAPEWLPALMGQAESAIAANQSAAARTALEAAARVAADDPDTLITIAAHHRDGLNDAAAARRIHAELRRRFPNHPRADEFR
ncbi:MAG: tetratricopeptide repeat protein [Verrucomicrobia bacterium]|nr:tetratricopeptide repeat protein [Verrucomicrobiota bacterium]MCH8514532.1 tetratricopeptide repeat protein [Kiritimatiellia bacterium]